MAAILRFPYSYSKRVRPELAYLLALAGLAACGGDDAGTGSSGAAGSSAGGTGGTAGTGGTSGSSGTAGANGSAGTSGGGGSAGAGGTAGTSGVGGTAGTAGSAGSAGTGGSAGLGGAGAGGTSGTAGSGGTGAGGTGGVAGAGGTGAMGGGGAGGTAGSSGTGGAGGSPTFCTPNLIQSCFTGDAALVGVGTCVAGQEQCLPDGSAWGPCNGEVLPQTETCDGLDNDCDGVADQTFACVLGATSSCTTSCGSTGSRICTASCDFPAACTPPAEVCNGADDDCDGAVDNGLSAYGAPVVLGNVRNPAVAYSNGADVFGITYGKVEGGVGSTRLQLVAPTGTTTGTTIVDASVGGASSIAANGSNFLVAWRDPTAASVLRVQSFSATGTPNAAAWVSSPNTVLDFVVSAFGSGFAALYFVDVGGGLRQLHVALFNANGTNTQDLNLYQGAALQTPFLVPDATGGRAFWTDATDPYNIYEGQLTALGQFTAAWITSIAATASLWSAVSAPSGYLMGRSVAASGGTVSLLNPAGSAFLSSALVTPLPASKPVYAAWSGTRIGVVGVPSFQTRDTNLAALSPSFALYNPTVANPSSYRGAIATAPGRFLTISGKQVTSAGSSVGDFAYQMVGELGCDAP